MKTPTVLIVDADPNIRELISVNLIAAGCSIAVAVDGKDAIEKINAEIPNLIILDVMMPEIDGWELCKWVRDDPRFSGVKILMLTAKGTSRDKLIGRQIFKADEYITKPFDIGLLQQTVSRLLHAE
jgi:DNA-binding response OmpR family regulator